MTKTIVRNVNLQFAKNYPQQQFPKRQIKKIIANLPLLTCSSWYPHYSMDPILLLLVKSIFHHFSNHLNFENHQSLVSSKPCSTTKFQQAVTTQEGAFFVLIKITMTTFHCLIASLWRYFCWLQKYVFISQLPRKMTAEVKTNIEKAKIGRYENLNPNWYISWDRFGKFLDISDVDSNRGIICSPGGRRTSATLFPRPQCPKQQQPTKYYLVSSQRGRIYVYDTRYTHYLICKLFICQRRGILLKTLHQYSTSQKNNSILNRMIS